MNIGEASRLTGLSARTIRHYEAEGIIAPATRGRTGYRSYGPQDIRVLRFVRNARQLGFDLGETRKLVQHWQAGPLEGGEIEALLEARVRTLLRQESELRATRLLLEDLQRSARDRPVPACRIVALLADDELQLSGTAEAVPDEA